MSRNPVVKDLKTPKYKPRVVPNKRKDQYKRDEIPCDTEGEFTPLNIKGEYKDD